MIPNKRLEDLKQLFKEEGRDISDADAITVGTWLLARAKSVPYEIPAGKEEEWKEILAQARHPHDGTT